MNQTKRVGIWIRVSTDMQVEGDSPEHHEQRARYYVQAKEGWHVAEVYRLDALTGKSIIDYPETKRMLEDIRRGHISGLVFSKLARLARNVRELLDIADYFKIYQADLISLAESIDTSSPAGRFFYTLLAAMAEWERAEIADRVAASVPIRARMGKPLGGAATYGYRWNGNDLEIDEKEAPVRKLLYELFLKHQRKKAAAKALNSLGYRTRNGSPFSDTTVSRLLRDPTAKGERIANYTKSLGEGKKWALKPESDWVRLTCPAIVSAKLWDECNAILDTQESKRAKPGPKAVHLLSGLVKCSCGKTMYIFHNQSNVFSCKACRNRIGAQDLDEIYQTYLQDYLNGINPDEYVKQSDEQLEEKKALLTVTNKERSRLAKRMSELVNLRLDGELSKESFAVEYKPLEARASQLDAQIPQLEAEIDVRTIQLMSTDRVLTEAKALYEQWADMSFEQKRGIVETITTSIEVGKEDITINLAYAPPIPSNSGKKATQPQGFILATNMKLLG